MSVCVACKLPNGLVINGVGKQATLLGPNKVPIEQRFGGYAITQNVPADLWKAWSQANADSELIQNKIIFAEENVVILRTRALGRNAIHTGLEQATHK